MLQKIVRQITNPIVLSIFSANRPGHDLAVSNLEMEDGFNLLQENGGFILLEPSSLGDPGMIGSTFIIGASALA
jgi:hypothetical protein